MIKIIQFKAMQSGSLIELAQNYLAQNFKEHPKFMNQPLGAANPICYVSGKKVSIRMKDIKAKAPIILCLPSSDESLQTKSLDPSCFVYKEKGLLVANKVSGLSSQTTFKATDDSLVHQILWYLIESQNFPKAIPYLGMHHRLDRDTSGLLLFTLKPSKNKAVSELFKERKIRKVYEALVVGNLPGEKWTNEKSIAKGYHARHRFYFRTHASGESAFSEFEKIKTTENGEHWIRCRPKTGRTHQLRVHLLSNGLKIVGDRVYGARGKDKPMRLHARSLSFDWDGEAVVIDAGPNWPEALAVETQ